MAGLWLTVAVAGCGGGSASSPTAAGPRTASAPLSDGLTATLAQNESKVPTDGMVTYTLTLANNTTQPITYLPHFGGGGAGAADVPALLTVTDPHGSLVYPTGSQSGAIEIGPATTLAPGQSVSGTVSTSGADPAPFSTAGQYTAVAEFILSAGQGNQVTGGVATVTLPLTVVGPQLP